MMRRLLALFPIGLLAFQAGGPSTTTRNLQTMTELARDPGGERLALLTEGLPVTILEPGERWTRVRIEGWVATADIEEAIAAPIPAQTPPVPARAVPAASSLSGSIFVLHEGKTVVGRTTAVRLVGDPAAAAERAAGLRGACQTRRSELVEEAARLKKTMDSAMKQEDTTAAFAKFDEAKWARQDVLKTLQHHDSECIKALDETFRQSERARVLSDDLGAFTFPDAAPGDYLVVAWVEADQMRFEWEVPVALRTGERLVRDLTDGNLTRSAPLPAYK